MIEEQIYILSISKSKANRILDIFKENFKTYIQKSYSDRLLLKDGRTIKTSSYQDFNEIGLRNYKKIDCEYFIELCYKNENDNLKQQNKDLEERIEKAKTFINEVYNSLINVDKPIIFYDKLLEIIEKKEV